MAKGNLFLGFGAGKVGDVVFYRANNEQMARARNRRPANPNSVKQRVQRAVLASVARLYSIGYEIFDHSFEGEKVGVGSQRAFLRHNVPVLRALVVSDLNSGFAGSECRGRVTAPRLAVAVPFDGIVVSYGSYPQLLFQLSTVSSVGSVFSLPAPISPSDTVAAYARRNGLVPGDIYTLLSFAVNSTDGDAIRYDANGSSEDSDFNRIFTSRFSYVQFRVKDNVLDDTTEFAADSLYSVLFEFAGSTRTSFDSYQIEDRINCKAIDGEWDNGVIACIRSREDTGLRSESVAHWSGSYEFGLTSSNIAKVWGLEAGLSGSELILEGEEFQNG